MITVNRLNRYGDSGLLNHAMMAIIECMTVTLPNTIPPFGEGSNIMYPRATADDSMKENQKSISVPANADHKKQEVRPSPMLQAKLSFQKPHVQKPVKDEQAAQTSTLQASHGAPPLLKDSAPEESLANTLAATGGASNNHNPPSEDQTKKAEVTGIFSLPAPLQPRQQIFSIFLPAAERKRLLQEVILFVRGKHDVPCQVAHPIHRIFRRSDPPMPVCVVTNDDTDDAPISSLKQRFDDRFDQPKL